MPLLADILLITTIVLVVMAPMTASFLQCWADRARAGETGLPKGRSHCDSCGKTLAAIDLVPIAAWIWNRGTARCCGARLSPALIWPEAIALILAIWGALVASPPLAAVTVAMVWTLQAILVLHSVRVNVAIVLIALLGLAGLGLSAAGLSGPLTAHLIALVVGLAATAASRLIAPLRPFTVAFALLAASGAVLGAPFLGITVGLAALAAPAFRTVAPNIGLPVPNWPHAGVLGVAAGLWLTWLYGLAV